MFNTAGVASPIPSDMSKALEVGINPLLVDTMTDFDTLLAYVFHRQPFIPWPIKRAFALQAVANAEFNRLVFDAYKNDEASRLEPRLAEIE
ncbi:MAG: hypothetical protein GTO71_14175, partial [Woeseiaceae bacterium]|nr:hypothetical protein [Woeseiaceae bacterium]NIP22198.1 hypothetical protein [Woeseiaceae bacterium]